MTKRTEQKTFAELTINKNFCACFEIDRKERNFYLPLSHLNMNVAMNATGLSDSDLLEEDVMLTNDNTTEFELDGFQEFANYFQFIVEGIAILIVGIIGVGINLVALGILFRKRVSSIKLLFYAPIRYKTYMKRVERYFE